MGWASSIFGSKKRTVVSTVVSRMIDDDSLPDAVRSATINSLFRKTNLAENIVNALMYSIAVKAESLFTYGGNGYVHGLPSGQAFTSTAGRQQVEAQIEALENDQILLEYLHYGPLNLIHAAWVHLDQGYGYDPLTNALDALSATHDGTCYLEDMQLIIPNATFDDFESAAKAQWGPSARGGRSPTRPTATPESAALAAYPPIIRTTASGITEEFVRVTWAWQTGDLAANPVQTGTMDLSPAVLAGGSTTSGATPETADYFHARYTTGDPAIPALWMYEHDSGAYPPIDAVFSDNPPASGTYFPFIYLRTAHTPVVTGENETDTAALHQEASTKKALGYLGIDLDDLSEAIHENPDIDDIEQAIVAMGVPPASENAAECRYLFDYFSSLEYAMNGSAGTTTEGGIWPGIDELNRFLNDETEVKSLVIADLQFRLVLRNKGIYRRHVAGNIGETGSYQALYEDVTYEEEWVSDTDGKTYTTTSTTKVHKYRSQITPAVYEEIIVNDLHTLYYIYKDYHTVADKDDDNLLIPIDHSVTVHYESRLREELYARSLHLIYNAKSKVQLKWYQTPLFSAIIIIIAIAITIASYGADGGQTTIWALGLTGTAGLIVSVIMQLIVGQLISLAYSYIVKEIGSEAAMILAVLAIAFGAYQVIDAGGMVSQTWASELLQVASGLSQAGMAQDFEDLLADQETFEDYKEVMDTKLADADALLTQSVRLDPLLFIGETPDNFYNRTIHSGNLASTSYEAIHSFVDLKLKLPAFTDTAQGF